MSGFVNFAIAAAVVLALGALAGWVLLRRRRRSGSASGTATTAPATAAQAPPPDADLIGRYRIERELGRGAMGTVYLCRDPQSGTALAVKTMALTREFAAGRDLDEARERFFREAEMAGRLHHPDIVAVLDAGESRGLAFIAMEHASGHDLLRHTVPGRLLPADAVVRIVARVARALAHAHRQGVVHRDVKPANVIVDADAGSVKVTDFGIARIADASRTRTGLMLGTPAFMSPEQLAGDRLDGRTDLYSLGVMAFQLFTGVLPHPSESMAALMHQIANEPAPDLRALRPELPESLARVIARALQKQPAARHADGDAMATELEAVHLADAPVHVADEAGANPAGTLRARPPESPAFEATRPLPHIDPRHNAID